MLTTDLGNGRIQSAPPEITQILSKYNTPPDIVWLKINGFN